MTGRFGGCQGFALMSVMMTAGFFAIIALVVVTQQTRMAEATGVDTEQTRIYLLDKRLKTIFALTDLCTCNLRGLSKPEDGDLIVDSTSSERAQFGFYRLGSPRTDVSRLCNRSLEAVNSVIHTQGNFHLPPNSSVLIDELRLKNFEQVEWSDPSNPTLSKHRAHLGFSVTDRAGLRRTNNDTLADLTLYLEMETTSDGLRITRCLPNEGATCKKRRYDPDFSMKNFEAISGGREGSAACFPQAETRCGSQKVFHPGGGCCGTYACDVKIERRKNGSGEEEICLTASDMQANGRWEGKSFRDCRPFPIESNNGPELDYSSGGSQHTLFTIDENYEVLGSCDGPAVSQQKICPEGGVLVGDQCEVCE